MKRYQPTQAGLNREADALTQLLARALDRLGVEPREETTAGTCYQTPATASR